MGLFSRKESKELVRKEQFSSPSVVQPVTEETVDQYLKAFGLAGNLEEHEVQAFRHMATMYNLNPFKREIHCVAYGYGDRRTLSIITGYEVYIEKAEKSGKLEYWEIQEPDPSTPLETFYATLVVKRRDRQKEQRWTTYFTEAAQYTKEGKLNSQWRKQPRFMTKKVTMGQGFRLFFEDVMHGMPYTAEEAEQYESEPRDITPNPQPVQKDSSPEKENPVDQGAEKAWEEAKNDDPVDYKKEIMKLVNAQGKIPNVDKAENVIPAYRECKTDEDFKTLYYKICEDYSIEQ